jgi:anthraniloyl-CoA monooxygenase
MKRTIAVIGGGPAGLMAARMLARDHPGWAVTVFERLAPDDTFGFGVGLTRGLLSSLQAAAPVLHDELVAACASFHSAAFRLPEGVVELPSSHAGAISRARLLQILLDRARRDGVEVRIGASPALDDVRDGADLVIAADGVSSASREALADELGATEQTGRGLFIWCGAEVELEGTVFMPVHTEHGTFVAHAYPYAPGRSTFVIETDTETVARAECRTDDFAADGDSDETSLRYLSSAFSELLGGAAFLGNRSRWMHFRTIRCRRWHHDNIVVLGDAAATAHPSLGSGTKLALEAAIALAAALRHVGDAAPASRLPEFERTVRPYVERLQERARRSQLWWESFPTRLDLSGARIAFAYMSRAGAVSLEDLHRAAPALADQAVADFAGVTPDEVPAGDLQSWILNRPVQWNGSPLPARIVGADWAQSEPELTVDLDDPWGADAHAMLARLADTAGDGPNVILTGADSRSALLDRLALGERIRSELGARVAVTCAQPQLPDAVDGLVAGRTDLIKVGGR